MMTKIVHGDTGSVSRIHTGVDIGIVEATKVWIDVALIDATKIVLGEMADELEAMYREEYMDSEGNLFHPLYERRYNRDMEIVHRARRLTEMLNVYYAKVSVGQV